MGAAEGFVRMFTSLRQLQLQKEEIAVRQETARTQYMQSMLANVATLPPEARDAVITQYEEVLGIPLPHVRSIAAGLPESVGSQQARALANSVRSGAIDEATVGASAINTTAAGAVVDEGRVALVREGLAALEDDPQNRRRLARGIVQGAVAGTTVADQLMLEGTEQNLSDPQIKMRAAGIKLGVDTDAATRFQAALQLELQQKQLAQQAMQFNANLSQQDRQFLEQMDFNYLANTRQTILGAIGQSQVAAGNVFDFYRSMNPQARSGAGGTGDMLQDLRADTQFRQKLRTGRVFGDPLERAMAPTVDEVIRRRLQSIEQSMYEQPQGSSGQPRLGAPPRSPLGGSFNSFIQSFPQGR